MDSARKATVTYTGDGAQLKYSFPFDYLRKAFIKVQNIAGDNIKDLVLGTDYSVDDKQVTLVTPIASGNHLKIYRSTTTEPLVEWQDASVLRSADLSLQEIQLLHLSEETLDRVQEGGLSTDPQDSDVWDARFKRMKNLLDPNEEGDAVTLRYLNNNRDGIIGAITSTGDVQTKRVITEGDTQEARVVSTGNTYVDTMTELKDVATTKASESSDSAELSKSWAISETSPDGVGMSSRSWAEASKIYASNAKTSETNAKTSETNAKSSETNANSYMTNANAYMTNASDSATKAKASETNAKASETNAAKSAQEAKVHADNAATHDPDVLIAEAHHYIKRSTEYSVNDVLSTPNLPYGTVLKVTQAGTTGADEPDWSEIKDNIGIGEGASSGESTVQQLLKMAMLMAHPVGSIYESTTNQSPAVLFGGTWEEMEAGRVLVSTGTASTGTVYNAGDKGGEEKHKLSADENGPHTHDCISGNGSRSSATRWAIVGTGVDTLNKGNVYNFAATQSSGDGKPHNNMQPFEVVYRWKRTA